MPLPQASMPSQKEVQCKQAEKGSGFAYYTLKFLLNRFLTTSFSNNPVSFQQMDPDYRCLHLLKGI